MGLLKDQIFRTFDQKEVGIVEFAESSEYIGKPLFPRQRVFLKLMFLEELDGYEEDVLDQWIRSEGDVIISPKVRERVQWLRDNNYKHFPEIVMVGGRRSSKGFLTSIAMAKKMFDTWKLGDPGTYYGIDPDKQIYFSCVAVSEEQAKKFQYADLVSAIINCRALKDSIGKVQEKTITLKTPIDEMNVARLKGHGSVVGRDFAKLRANPLPANADSIRGSATLAVVFDEMAFFESTEGNKSSAEECYNAMKPSLATFGRDAMIMCNSSPYTKIGKFYEKWMESLDTDSDGNARYPEILSLSFPSWELYRDWKKVNRKPLMASPDLDETDPQYEDVVDRIIEARKEEEKDPNAFKVERRAQWAEVVSAFLDPVKVDHAFRAQVGDRDIKRNMQGSSYVYGKYVAHGDPSSTTAGFGFAMAHLEWFDEEVDETTIKTVPHVVFDFVKRWNPQEYENNTIDYLAILPEIAHYLEIFRPDTCTFDQFNSVAAIQWLNREMRNKRISGVKIHEKTASPGINYQRWDLFRTAMNLGRVHIPPDCPDSNYASLELKFLQEKSGRVEKQDRGQVTTKDIADCIAECTFALLSRLQGWDGSDPFSDATSSFGAQGGFSPVSRQGTMADYYRNRRGMSMGSRTRSAHRRGRFNR